MGEAARNIQRHAPQFALHHPQLPLSGGLSDQMRNAVAHGCFQIDWRVVWSTIRRELPALAALVAKARQALIPGDPS